VKAYIKYEDEKYYLVNLAADNLLSPDGSIIPRGHATEITDRSTFRLVRDKNSLLLHAELFENI